VRARSSNSYRIIGLASAYVTSETFRTWESKVRSKKKARLVDDELVFILEKQLDIAQILGGSELGPQLGTYIIQCGAT
jgi:hypothetical protein